MGDSADGYPGLTGWGAKSASTVLARFGRLEDIPADTQRWGLPGARAAQLNETLRSRWQEALLYRQLATLRLDVPLAESPEDLEWRGARHDLLDLCSAWGDTDLPRRISRWQAA